MSQDLPKGRLTTGPATRALVVDDDPIIRSLVESRLSRIVDEIVEAEDGLAAWRLLAEQTFHIALVDLMMPNLNGFGLIRCRWGHPRTRHMPIVVVTSNEDRASIDKALEVGASAFMTKPLNWFVFNSHVSHLLRMATQAEAAELKMARAQAVSAAHAALPLRPVPSHTISSTRSRSRRSSLTVRRR